MSDICSSDQNLSAEVRSPVSLLCVPTLSPLPETFMPKPIFVSYKKCTGSCSDALGKYSIFVKRRSHSRCSNGSCENSQTFSRLAAICISTYMGGRFNSINIQLTHLI